MFAPVFRQGRRAAIEAAERSGGRILEIRDGIALSPSGHARRNLVFGLDISVTMVWKARRRVAEQELCHVDGLAVMDAERLALSNGCFGVVVAQYAVTAEPNLERVLDEFLSVLRTSGESTVELQHQL